jgi:hypothetical protein
MIPVNPVILFKIRRPAMGVVSVKRRLNSQCGR